MKGFHQSVPCLKLSYLPTLSYYGQVIQVTWRMPVLVVAAKTITRIFVQRSGFPWGREIGVEKNGRGNLFFFTKSGVQFFFNKLQTINYSERLIIYSDFFEENYLCVSGGKVF